MEETTTAVLTQFDDREREALRRFITEEKPGLSEGQAVRYLVRDSLIGLGVLDAR